MYCVFSGKKGGRGSCSVEVMRGERTVWDQMSVWKKVKDGGERGGWWVSHA